MYNRSQHAAVRTSSYIFNQLIPYIGNKRKLLRLIGQAIKATGLSPSTTTFLDLFAGSGVVARYAKQTGFRVIANDWEPYAQVLNTCAISLNQAPCYPNGRSYEQTLELLNALAGQEDWVSRHLCPQNDECVDPCCERLFYTRANGMRIDAIRETLREWSESGLMEDGQIAALLAPLLYQACYTSNTSGVFKGFHCGWGGKTETALYRIRSRLTLTPAIFHDNQRENAVLRLDATQLARNDDTVGPSIAYLDPPYNQHPYGANYHVLNSIALWDRPALSCQYGKHDKAAIRMDWRTERRSPYNYKHEASNAYENLMNDLRTDWILTSYSTDGNIPLTSLLAIACQTGATDVVAQSYKRYRVSRQRFSPKPVNAEFVLITQRRACGGKTAQELASIILRQESNALAAHKETAKAEDPSTDF